MPSEKRSHSGDDVAAFGTPASIAIFKVGYGRSRMIWAAFLIIGAQRNSLWNLCV